jgi:hypothetical protein
VTGVPNVEIMNEIESNINHRGNAYLASRISGSIDDYDQFLQGREKSHSLYCRSSEVERANLEDF